MSDFQLGSNHGTNQAANAAQVNSNSQAEKAAQQFSDSLQHALKASEYLAKVGPNDSAQKQSFREKKTDLDAVDNGDISNEEDDESIHKTINTMEKKIQKLGAKDAQLAENLMMMAQLKINELQEQGYHIRDINIESEE